VAPLLAGIIAYIDVNSNFDLLLGHGGMDGQDDHWIKDMWMDMLADGEVTIIKYR